MSQAKQTQIIYITIWVMFNLFSLHSAKAFVVPDIIYFGGIELRLNDNIKRAIEKEANRLLSNQTQWNETVSKSKILLPIIDSILSYQDDEFPADFKYLAILLSNFNNINQGIWQIDDDRAKKMGLFANDCVDERLNIILATKSIKKYLKSFNIYFNNWLYTLASYKEGFDNVVKKMSTLSEKDKVIGIKKINLSESEPQYLISFLAYKLLLEEEFKKNETIHEKAIIYTRGANKTLFQIAKETNVPLPIVEMYNQWLKASRIPLDKEYPVLLIISTQPEQLQNVMTDYPTTSTTDHTSMNISVQSIQMDQQEAYLQHVVQKGENIYTISDHYGVSWQSVQINNALTDNDKLKQGQILKIKVGNGQR